MKKITPMLNSRPFLIALIFTIHGSCFAMNMDFYPDEPALLGDRDATYQSMVNVNGKQQKKVQNAGLFDSRDSLTEQLFYWVKSNDLEKLKKFLDESAKKKNLNWDAEFDGLRALEVAMRQKNHNAACLLLLYGANIEHVRCRQHRALLRRFKIQAEAVAVRPPRARAGSSDHFGQSPAQSEDCEDNERAVGPAAEQQEDYGVEAAQEAVSALSDRQASQGSSDGDADRKVHVGCQSLICSIQ